MKTAIPPLARNAASTAFRETIRSLTSENAVTEVRFRDLWIQKTASEPGTIASGWYDPPPFGVAVIADDPGSPSRISFTSLRQPRYWPTHRTIDFGHDILYAYCSPISVVDRCIGDFAITLYFGHEPRLMQHFQNCLDAVQAVLAILPGISDSRIFYEESRHQFRSRELMNDVQSVTDTAPSDLGHTLPDVTIGDVFELSVDQKEGIRTRRKFINDATSWCLANEKWFTVEPQLRSTKCKDLPQVSFHLVCSKHNGCLSIVDDIFIIYREFMPGLRFLAK